MWVVGLDGAADDSLFDLNLATRPVALVMGSEGKGLSRLVAQRCDSVVSIPLRGALGSLNVSAAGTLACYGSPAGAATASLPLLVAVTRRRCAFA